MKYLVLNRRVFWLVILLLLSGVTTKFSGWPWVCWYHDWEMLQFEQSLRAVSFPVDSTILASKRVFGHLWGNGNHCDAMVMALVESDADEDTMSAFRTTKLKKPFTNGTTKLDLIRITNGAMYQVEEGKSWPVTLSNDYYTHSLAPEDNLWESSDIKLAQELIKEVSVEQKTQLYILRARDSIKNLFSLYPNYDLLDIRCH